jgi:hypothetical protein
VMSLPSASTGTPLLTELVCPASQMVVAAARQHRRRIGPHLLKLALAEIFGAVRQSGDSKSGETKTRRCHQCDFQFGHSSSFLVANL